ncbi:hypothetical protein GN956_G10608 [Arapaima gigas]
MIYVVCFIVMCFIDRSAMSIFAPGLGAAADEEDERIVESDAGRYRAERVSVAALLRISEENAVTEDGPYEWSAESGWDKAIQGWPQSPPLSCLFQTHRKGKRCKTEDKDFHCLLCIDAVLSERLDLENMADCAAKGYKSNPSPSEDLRIKGSFASTLLTRKASSQHVAVGHRDSEEHVLQACDNATEQVELGDRTSEDTRLHAPDETSLQIYNLASQWPLVRETCHKVAQTINSFSVLPAVRAGGPGNPRSPSTQEKNETTFSKAPSYKLSAEAGLQGVSEAGEKPGAERSHEITMDVPAGTAALEYSARPLPCSWPLHPGRNLLTTFSICVPKGEEPPFSSIEGTVPRVVYPFGKYVKQDDISTVANNQTQKLCTGLKSKNMKRPEPQLPLLFGTRVAIQASSHRLL